MAMKRTLTTSIARTISCLALGALTGCFTVYETPYPQTQLSPLGEGRELHVAVSGFEATVTTYMPVRGYTTVWRDDGPYHRGRYHGPRSETWTTTTYIPQVNESTVFIERAVDALEASGFVIATTNADYCVEAHFSGPVVTGTDRSVEVAWVLLSLLSADYSAQTWSARLKIREALTGKVLLMHDYSQKYAAAVWGPIPIFSPAASDATSYNTMQSWCLTALTDRVMADATAFLASRAP